MNATILLATPQAIEMNNTTEYVLGGIIGLLLLAYLFYSLVNPEKF